MANLVGVKWYLVILMPIYLMINGIHHIFMCLLPIIFSTGVDIVGMGVSFFPSFLFVCLQLFSVFDSKVYVFLGLGLSSGRKLIRNVQGPELDSQQHKINAGKQNVSHTKTIYLNHAILAIMTIPSFGVVFNPFIVNVNSAEIRFIGAIPLTIFCVAHLLFVLFSFTAFICVKTFYITSFFLPCPSFYYIS